MNRDDQKKLEAYLDRLVNLAQEKKALGDDMNEIVADCSESLGLDKRVVKRLAKLRGMNQIERAADSLLQESVDACLAALGMLADTPLGEAARKKVELQDSLTN